MPSYVSILSQDQSKWKSFCEVIVDTMTLTLKNRDYIKELLCKKHRLLKASDICCAEILCEVLRGSLVFDTKESVWFELCENGIWKRVIQENTVFTEVIRRTENLMDELESCLRLADHETQEEIKSRLKTGEVYKYKQIDELRDFLENRKTLKKFTGIRNIVALLKSNRFLGNDDLNWYPAKYMLPVKNGFLDGVKRIIRPIVPQDYVCDVVPTEYVPTAKSELWESCVREWLGGNDEAYRGLKKVTGAAVFGAVEIQKFVLLFGDKGQNGKSVFMNVMRHVLGNTGYHSADSTMLQLSRNGKSAEQASPAVLRLRGKRIIAFNEVKNGCQWDSQFVKNLASVATQTSRDLFKGLVEFENTGIGFLCTNEFPSLAGRDEALKKRLISFEFPNSYSMYPVGNQKPAILDLQERILENREAVLNWCVEGFYEFMDQGFTEFTESNRLNDEEIEEDDNIYAFLTSEYVEVHEPGIFESEPTKCTTNEFLKCFNKFCILERRKNNLSAKMRNKSIIAIAERKGWNIVLDKQIKIGGRNSKCITGLRLTEAGTDLISDQEVR